VLLPAMDQLNRDRFCSSDATEAATEISLMIREDNLSWI
jgi:hypothetical protein